MTKDKIDFCKCCGRYEELCISHSIPDAFYRDIKKNNNGHMLTITRDQSNTAKTSARGGVYMLCRDCEARFNSKFDAYFVNKVRSIRDTYEEYGSAQVDLNPEKILRAGLAILWRASHSDEDIYAHLSSDLASDALLRLIFSDQIALTDHFSIGLCLISGISESSSEISKVQKLRQLILPPLLSDDISFTRKRRGTKYKAIVFIVDGVYVSVIIPKLGHPKNKNSFFLQPKRNRHRLISQNLLQLPFAGETVIEIIRKSFHSASSS